MDFIIKGLSNNENINLITKLFRLLYHVLLFVPIIPIDSDE